MFVGTDSELEQVTAALSGAASGRGRAVLISGEPGIGKTRLARELSDLAEGQGIAVAWGRCPEDAAPPKWTI